MMDASYPMIFKGLHTFLLMSMQDFVPPTTLTNPTVRKRVQCPGLLQAPGRVFRHRRLAFWVAGSLRGCETTHHCWNRHPKTGMCLPSPENEWLEDEIYKLEWPIFRGELLVSGRVRWFFYGLYSGKSPSKQHLGYLESKHRRCKSKKTFTVYQPSKSSRLVTIKRIEPPMFGWSKFPT